MGALILATDACADLSNVKDKATAVLYAGVALTAGVGFVCRQKKAPQPLLPLDLFASKRFSLAALTSLASFVGHGDCGLVTRDEFFGIQKAGGRPSQCGPLGPVQMVIRTLEWPLLAESCQSPFFTSAR